MPAITIRDEAHLRELHKQYMTASRLGALYGDGYTSRWQEHMILRGKLEPAEIEGTLLERGKELQPIIAAKLQRAYPAWAVHHVEEFYAHPTIARFGASPDQIIQDPSRPLQGVGEAKVVNAIKFREEWSDGPPINIELQLHAQMMCFGTDWGVISALVIGTYEWQFKTFVRELRPRVVTKIERDLAEFFSEIDEEREPKIDPLADADAIAHLYVDASDPPIDLSTDNRIGELASELLMARSIESEGKKRVDVAKSEILAKLGNARGAKIPGGQMIDAPTQRRGAYEVKAAEFRVIKLLGADGKSRKPTLEEMTAAARMQAPLQPGA